MTGAALSVGESLGRIMGYAYQARQAVMFIGNHGIGKSEFLRSAAEDLGQEYRLLQMDTNT